MKDLRLIRALKRSLASSSGFTLVELIVALGILSAILGMVGDGFFQVLSIQKFWKDGTVATKDLRHAASWFAGDALNATDVLDAGGVNRLTCQPNPAINQVTLTWTDAVGTTQSATYNPSGTTIVREVNTSGILNVMAKNVVANSLQFSLCGNLLSMQMSVEADRENTEEITLRTYLRKLQ